ncbi:MAG TPA: hypothetical protein V6D14_11605 [Coleofasciculaceae cyanobacterium]|jgi:hypothetical protein
MGNWIELDKQWGQRSKQMFQRCVNETDLSKFQLYWYLACESEKRRLDWKGLCLQQENKIGAVAVVNTYRSLFS